MDYSPPSNIDFTGITKVLIYVNPEDVDIIAADGVRIGMASGGNNPHTNGSEWWFGSDDGLSSGGGWFVIELNPQSPDTTNGTPATISAVDLVRFEFVHGGTAGQRCSWAWFRSIPSGDVVAQKPSISPRDMSSNETSYRMDVRANNVSAINEVKVWWSNTNGSGTTPPADRREFTFTSAQLSEDAFVELSSTLADEGSPGDLDAVQTVGFSFSLDSSFDGLDKPKVWVDHLERENS
jgi:hypothetical protein